MQRRRAGAVPSYEVVVPRELLEARLRTERTAGAVLIAIGGLALLIGGIGIMNIMLASVVERTGEIGVRRAFGAHRADIVAQFTIEAALVSAIGGVAGLVTGAGLAWSIAVAAGWPILISLPAIAWALALAVGVGLLAGVYPARVAAHLDPAHALRAP
jgi:putative ABC transport system permease protein